MDCITCHPLLAEFALGQLPDDERRRVVRHLAGGCPQCARALREIEEAWVLLVETLPPTVVPEHIDAALLRQLALAQGDGEREQAAESTDASRRSEQHFLPIAERGRPSFRAETSANDAKSRPVFTNERDDLPPVPDRRRLLAGWILAATLLLAATIGLFAWYSSANREDEPDQFAVSREQMQQLRFEFERFSRDVNSSRLRLASLHERDRQSVVHGYVVWDRWARQVHFYAFGLPQLAEGRVYRIWLVRDGADPLAAGTLDPQPNGTARILVDVPGEVAEPFQVAVTEQDAEAPLDSAVPPWLTSEVE